MRYIIDSAQDISGLDSWWGKLVDRVHKTRDRVKFKDVAKVALVAATGGAALAVGSAALSVLTKKGRHKKTPGTEPDILALTNPEPDPVAIPEVPVTEAAVKTASSDSGMNNAVTLGVISIGLWMLFGNKSKKRR